MRVNRDTRILLLGLLLLASGPALLGLAPELRPADPTIPWVMPSTVATAQAPTGYSFSLLITGLEPREQLGLMQENRSFVFQRFTYSVTAMDKDLVPWFSQNWRDWIRQTSFRSGRDGRIQVTRLERLSGTGGAVVAQSFRVGPYLTASFNRAKLLQIPAKLQGFGNLDLVSLAVECGRDCDAAATEVALVLDQIADANTTDHGGN
jgi:hypothetical protein